MAAGGSYRRGDVRGNLEEARACASLSDEQLWLRFFGLGGEATAAEVQSYFGAGGTLPREDVNTLVQAFNEHFLDRGLGMPVPYQER